MAHLQAVETPTLQFGAFLDKFPYDVKALIYKCVFQGSPDGKTPPLLIALRSRHGKYKDALRIYYQVTWLTWAALKIGILKRTDIHSEG